MLFPVLPKLEVVFNRQMVEDRSIHCNVFDVTAFSYSDKLLVSVFVQLPFLESTSLYEVP